MRTFARENGLSLFCFGIFAASLVGQSFAGQRAFNAEQVAQSSDFGGAVMENWRSG